MRNLLLLILVCFGSPTLLAEKAAESLFVPWKPLPTRAELFNALEPNYDLVVIGGGATGAGVALDASARGLKVALVEKGDFCSQTSSKSTKLVHGGVRYLEKAIKNFDKQQYQLVKEALHERGTLLEIAPFVVQPVKIVTPIYQLSQIPYLWSGLKLYDWVAGNASLGSSKFMKASTIKKAFPHIKSEGLKGGVSYWDAQFNDTRLNITIILSAMQLGAHAFNYTEATAFVKDEGQIVGVEVRDCLRGDRYTLRCRKVVNATGPFSDTLRQLDNPSATSLICPSAGTHILLDRTFVADNAGILIPKTEDGRVMFLLPWQGHTIAGTTDLKAPLSDAPRWTQQELDYLLATLSNYLDTELREQDVQAIWTGQRPLVRDVTQDDPSKLCRNHLIEVSNSGLVSIMGGKWTIFRLMAEQTVDVAFPDAPPSVTAHLKLMGAEGYTHDLARLLEKETGLAFDICEHLSTAYGNLAFEVVRVGGWNRLAPGHPMIEAEVIWAMENEYAQTLADVLCRRTRLAFLDSEAALHAVKRVAELMLQEDQVSEAVAELTRWNPSTL